MPDNSKYSIIFSRRHPEIDAKEDIWKLIHNSYKGGSDYQDAEYLFKNPRESENSYSARKKRAVYFNQTQPLADLLAGFLFVSKPQRKNTDLQSYLTTDATKSGDSLDEFMKTVAIHSILFTCGVLVDSPSFDPEQYPTEKSRKEAKLNPYCTLYFPFQIRDFHVAEDGMLDWLILDNSFYDNSDIMEEGHDRTIYRVWTREYFQDFEEVTTDKNKKTIEIGPETPHNIGYVPFRFINWKDDNNDFIAESVFEDPAMISRLIYNKMSEMDEMMAAGSFKVLMYPSTDGTIPSQLISGGIGSLSAIPYNGNLGKAPSFEGASLNDVAPFLKAMEFYISEILKKIGLDTDETKDYVKSGLAKQIDFQKVKTLLVSGSMALEELEKWIFKTAAKWEGSESKVTVDYVNDYNDEDIRTKFDLTAELLVYPFKSLRKHVTKLQVSNVLSGRVPQEDLEEILNEIDTESDKVFEGEQALKLNAIELAQENQSDSTEDEEQASTEEE